MHRFLVNAVNALTPSERLVARFVFGKSIRVRNITMACERPFFGGIYFIEQVKDYDLLLKFIQDVDKFIEANLKDLRKRKGRI